ncbi:MAG: hypothetical protein DRG83_17520 [Deltaproteobacteria bacterium]|nr:MAG: hypothetical protein DRG83_17520 [Deltaproteobacteria bacterium]
MFPKLKSSCLRAVTHRQVLSNVAVILSILGVITFSLFIFEEAIQMTVFGTWPAQYSKDWDLVMEGCDTIDSINRAMKVFNHSVGWIQPFAFFSYRSFGKATDYYVKALKAKVFANSPECFLGRKVEFGFVPKRILSDGDGIKLINGRICVLAKDIPETRKVIVSGVIERKGNFLIIKADSILPRPQAGKPAP